jgi:hypothetical protein
MWGNNGRYFNTPPQVKQDPKLKILEHFTARLFTLVNGNFVVFLHVFEQLFGLFLAISGGRKGKQ